MAPNSTGNTWMLSQENTKSNHAKETATRKISQLDESNSYLTAYGKKRENVKPSSEKEVNKKSKINKNGLFEQDLVWTNVIAFIILHIGSFYGLHIILFEKTFILFCLSYFFILLTNIGVTAGAHRLWSHKTYKAKWPLRIFLMILQTAAMQNCIYEWVRDHRAHHKFCDTTGDPHNSTRGFWFSHMGWLIMKKHPDVKEKGKLIDLSDIKSDPVVMFQKKYFSILMPICCFLLPALVPWSFLGYSFRQSFYVCSIFRYMLSLHLTWCVNSAAHLWGFKPYDKAINPSDNRFVIFIGHGEGFHNYHHVFPWDYKAAELGSYFFNSTKVFIDYVAKMGLAYDLRSASDDMIRKRILRTGDGTHKFSTGEKYERDAMISQLNHEKEEQAVWGWDDQDMTVEDRKDATIKFVCS